MLRIDRPFGLAATVFVHCWSALAAWPFVCWLVERQVGAQCASRVGGVTGTCHAWEGLAGVQPALRLTALCCSQRARCSAAGRQIFTRYGASLSVTV